MKYKKLPVYKQRTKILEKLSKHQVIVVESPTGSGKTTQLPQILLEAGYAKGGMIGVTQPRRIAAVSVAEFIANQQKTSIPDVVGYKMRFEDKTGPNTNIKIMTDGILLQEIKADYDLTKYSVIIVDEAHDRSLNIDFIIGLLKRILSIRKDFKVIISSATINAEIFARYFDDAPVVFIDTEIYPVDIHYRPIKEEKNQEDPLIAKVTNLVGEICDTSKKGDVLIFFSGVKTIKDCTTALNQSQWASQLEILPLYSRLSKEEQERVFKKYPGKRKIIISTNIAETSVTIDGIEFVIDSGLAKMNYYNPHTFTSSLIELNISKASANQRKGRAGRTKPGTCYRLYKFQDYEKRELYTLEEIFRTDLSEVVMRMSEIGITEFENFSFLSPPGYENVKSAINTLELLGVLTKTRELTNSGKMMAQFPLNPRHSRIIIEAIMKYPDVLEEVLIATAFLTTNSPYLLPQGEEIAARKAHHTFRDDNGDFISYLIMYNQFLDSRNKEKFCELHYLDYKVMLEIINIKEQLQDIVSELGIPIQSGGPIKNYLCSIASGLIQFVCVKTRKGGFQNKGGYKSLTASNIAIHPGSVMFRERPQYIVAGEIVKTTRTYARSVSELKGSWLKDISPTLESLITSADKERKSAKPVKSREKKEESLDEIRIGSEIFRLARIKGKKRLVKLPWNKIKPALEKLSPEYIPQFKGMKGTLIFKKMEVLSLMNLDSLLEIVPKLSGRMEILKSWPNKNFNFNEESGTLLEHLDNLLFLAKKKKHEKRLGFLTIHTDQKGVYWFKPGKNFYTSISESMGSLEIMADEAVENLSPEEQAKINTAYRGLAELIDRN